MSESWVDCSFCAGTGLTESGEVCDNCGGQSAVKVDSRIRDERLAELVKWCDDTCVYRESGGFAFDMVTALRELLSLRKGDTVRDAERYRWLCGKLCEGSMRIVPHGNGFAIEGEHQPRVGGKGINEAIDAASEATDDRSSE